MSVKTELPRKYAEQPRSRESHVTPAIKGRSRCEHAKLVDAALLQERMASIKTYLDCVSPYSYYALLYLQKNRHSLASHGVTVE